MTSNSNKKQQEDLLENYSTDREYSIYEITCIYKKLNKNLLEVMERMENILLIGHFDAIDINFLKKRNCEYRTLQISNNDIREHDPFVFNNILEATLMESYEMSFKFYKSDFVIDWFDIFHKYRTIVLKMDGDTTFLLSYLNKLNDSLFLLHNDFNEDQPIAYFEEEFEFSEEFEFELVYQEMAKEENLIIKRKILIDNISDRELLCIRHSINPREFEPMVYFKNCCLDALDIINNQIENRHALNFTKPIEDKAAKTPESSMQSSDSIAKLPDFTTKRQVLALYYLLNEVDKNTNSIDRTVKARFIHFLTGKNESNIYKILSEPHKGLDNDKNNKSAIKDLEYIKKHFDELGLKSIVQKIHNDTTNS